MKDKKKLKPAHIVALVVVVLLLAVVFIPEDIFEKKADEYLVEAEYGDMLEEEKQKSSEDKGTLKIVDEKDTMVKFDTVFGGVDYDKEYAEVCSTYSYEFSSALAKVKEYVSDSQFDALHISPEQVTTTDNIYDSIPSMPVYWNGTDTLNTSYFNNNAVVSIEGCVTCAVIDNYYRVSWVQNTNVFIVDDCRYTYFRKAYFQNEMYHLGDLRVITIDHSSSKVIEDAGYVIVLQGAVGG